MKHILFSLLLFTSLTASAQLDALMQDAMNAKANAYLDYDAERPTQMLEEAIAKLKQLVPTKYKDIVVLQLADAYYEMGNTGHSYSDNGTTMVNAALDSSNVYYTLAVAANGSNDALRARLAETQVWAQQYDLATKNLQNVHPKVKTPEGKPKAFGAIAERAYLMAMFAEELSEENSTSKKIDWFKRSLSMYLVLGKIAPDNEELAMQIFQISFRAQDQEVHMAYRKKLKAMKPKISDAELSELLRTDGN